MYAQMNPDRLTAIQDGGGGACRYLAELNAREAEAPVPQERSHLRVAVSNSPVKRPRRRQSQRRHRSARRRADFLWNT